MEKVEKKSNAFTRFFTKRGMGQVLTVTAGLVVLCLVFAWLNPNFGSWANVSNLLRQIAPFLIVGIAQGYVLITGNIDLSIGSVLGMSGMIAGTLMTKGNMNPILAILITMLACLAVGVLNGFLVAKCKLPPFIATLGTMTIARGIAQWANNGRNTDYIAGKAPGVSEFFYSGKTISFGDFTIYSAVWIAIVLWIVFNFVLSRTRTGRHIYAIGSNVEAAKLSGVSVFKTTTVAYVVSAFCSCIAGLVSLATTSTGMMDAGMSYEMYGVAAAVIGGISTLGGQGILLGTIVGASVWGVLQNGLSLAGAPLALRNIIVGIIVVVSVLLDVIVRTGGKPRGKKILGVKVKEKS